MVYGRVYTIRSPQTTELYIGSTTQALSMRMSEHRRHYKRYLNGTFAYVSSYEILQYKDAYIELLFEGDFESKDALRKKEGEYIRDMECVNRFIAGRTQQEYYEENKEQILEQVKQYYEENKEQKLEYHKQYRDEHKEQIAEYHKQYRDEHKEQKLKYNKQYHDEHKEQILKQKKEYYDKNKKQIAEHKKQYRNEHKEQILEKAKQYRDAHKEELAEQRKQKFTCECGSVCRISDKASHKKSLKHQNFINSYLT